MSEEQIRVYSLNDVEQRKRLFITDSKNIIFDNLRSGEYAIMSLTDGFTDRFFEKKEGVDLRLLPQFHNHHYAVIFRGSQGGGMYSPQGPYTVTEAVTIPQELYEAIKRDYEKERKRYYSRAKIINERASEKIRVIEKARDKRLGKLQKFTIEDLVRERVMGE